MQDFQDLTILIVDDEEDIRMLVKETLSMFCKSKILEAKDGMDALEVLKNNDVSLIVSDIMMPKMNGLELLQKTSELYPNIITIMLTAYGNKNHIHEALKLHAFDFLEKPFSHDIMKTRVTNALNYCYHKQLLKLAMKDFIINNCKDVTYENFEAMSIEEKNKVLEMGSGLIKIKDNLNKLQKK